MLSQKHGNYGIGGFGVVLQCGFVQHGVSGFFVDRDRRSDISDSSAGKTSFKPSVVLGFRDERKEDHRVVGDS